MEKLNDPEKMYGKTKALTRGAIKWLRDRGFVPVVKEVWCGGRWIVDIAGACSPSTTECIKLKLLEPGADRYARFNQLPARPILAVVEIKASRSDYLRDVERKFNKVSKLPAHMPILFIPRGLLRPDEYPDGWWVLEMSEGGQVRLKARAPLRDIPLKRAYFFLDVLIRAYVSSIKYREHRMIQAADRQQEAARITKIRLTGAFKVLEAVVCSGVSVAEALRDHCGSSWDGGTSNQKTIDSLSFTLQKVAAHLKSV